MSTAPKTSAPPASRQTGQPQSGDTRPQVEGERAPRMPHERDESADSHAAAPQEVIKQAKRDIDAGLVDTDRGTPMDETYHRQVKERPPGKPESKP